LAPGAADLYVSRTALGPVREVEACPQAEPAREQVAKPDALGHGAGGLAEAGVASPRAPGADEADGGPARGDAPAHLGLDHRGALVLVACGGNAAQLDEGQHVERHVAVGRAAI